VSAITAALEERRGRLAALAAALVAVTLWASAFVGIRSAGRAFGPGELSLARLLVAALALGATGWTRGERLPSRAALRTGGPALLVAGLLWFGGYNLALNAGERRGDRLAAAVAYAGGVHLVPPLSILLGWLWLGEGPAALAYLGGARCLAGVGLARRFS
jgi:drug/metabolite transporter (DMT)-like permease